SWELLLSWVDILALLLLIVLYLTGKSKNRAWIRSRSLVELLRQIQILGAVIPSATGGDIKKWFEDQRKDFSQKLEDSHSQSSVDSRVREIWREQKDSLSRLPLFADDLTADSVQLYMARRARRQIGWFIDSKERLKKTEVRRSTLLISLYF